MGDKKKVVIVGGGFAGINAAKKFGNKKGVDVVLIDRRNHHLFQPLLYQVATAALNPAEIAYPIRTILKKYKNVDVKLSRVTGIDKDAKLVQTDSGELSYDFLILACGSTHSYFGNNKWENYAPGLKTLSQSTEIRRRVLMAFEKAASEKDIIKQRQHLTFVIVGGGPTGVELAGAIGELSRYTVHKDFKNLDTRTTRVILIEGGPRVLGMYPEHLSAKAMKNLEQLGVQVWVNAVTKIDDNGVYMGDEFVKASTVIWAAGVEPSPLNKKLDVKLDRGRVVTNEYCQIPKYENIYVLGDQAFFEQDGKPLPGLAPVAIQQGKYAAKNILNLVNGKANKPFHYMDKGSMATIGRNKAVMDAFGLRVSGVIAWLAWLFVHIMYLVGFKNRIIVLFQWAWSYLSFKKGSRLIIDREWRTHTKKDGAPIDS